MCFSTNISQICASVILKCVVLLQGAICLLAKAYMTLTKILNIFRVECCSCGAVFLYLV